ncbi:hypothetical protein PV761_23035 [Arthrobacter sp. CC3]|uniref:hypothetical protein n=1 Tax=Arthrobacter sp. CC3 TaxID=3029185 RepID=UPI0032672571
MLIKPVSLPRDLHLLVTPVAYIRRSDVHLLTARRNAWQNTTLKRYMTTEPAYSTVMSARAAAELRRRPGTYFVIDEKPSLVFDLAGLSLVVTHLNASPRFRSWKIPAAMTDRDTPITGLEVFNMFAGSRYREAMSGWRISDGKPDVILGVVESAALATSDGREQMLLRRSSVQSGGRMTFRIEQSTDADAAHLERIVEELAHLTQQKYPVHEIYQWGDEYFCKEDVRKLYETEPQRLNDYGFPVGLSTASEPPTFCSVCFRWFIGARPDDVE